MSKLFLVLVILAACLAIGYCAPTNKDISESAESKDNEVTNLPNIWLLPICWHNLLWREC